MMGRLLALCGWLAWQVGRPFRVGPLRRLGRAPVVAVAAILAVLAAAPLVMPFLDPQPEDAVVQQIFDGAVAHPEGWIRLHGRVVPLPESPTGEPGPWALLVDAEDTLRAVVLRPAEPLEAAESTTITGRLAPATVATEAVQEQLPIEATVFGTPPQIVPDGIVTLDAAPTPERVVPWWLSLVPALLAIMLAIGARVGYPLFRPSVEVDVLSAPLTVGERIPAAYGGQVGPNVRDLADPGGALFVMRRAPTGDVLTAQPLPDDGGVAPQPVTVGGSWTSGRIGYVFTVTETVPALRLRTELVDATFLFARTTERDRVAAMVTVER